MFRTPALLLIWSILGNNSAAQVTQQDTLAWMSYLEGAWTVKTAFETEVNGGTVQTVGTAQFRTQTNTAAVVARFTESERSSVEIGGWQADRQITQVNGYTSAGDWYQLEYKQLSASGGEGPMLGTLKGIRYTGNFVMKVKSRDNMEWTLKAKNKVGTNFTVSGRFIRKK